MYPSNRLLISTILLSTFIGLTIISVSYNISYNAYLWASIFAAISIGIIFFLKVMYRDYLLTPSTYIIFLFLIVPVIGIQGYHVYINIYHMYMGFGKKLTFERPLFVWYLGSMVFAIAVAITHKFFGKKSITSKLSWDYKKLKVLLIIFVCISASTSLLAIYKLGYIPILRGVIEDERFDYSIIIGENIVKSSRLWIIVFIISSTIYFREKKKKIYLLLMALSCFFVTMYGQRQLLFILLCYFFWDYQKFYELYKKIKLSYILVVAVLVDLLFLAISTVRRGHLAKVDALALVDKLLISTFAEWKEFSYVVNNFVNHWQFLKWKIFTGVFATLIPKEVFSLFGYDKSKLYDMNASTYFGDYFGHYAGIRIGVIGEAFAGVGISGMVLIIAGLGIMFAYFEKKYIVLDKDNPWLMLIIFSIAVMMILPILSFVNITDFIKFYGFFILLCVFFGTKRVGSG